LSVSKVEEAPLTTTALLRLEPLQLNNKDSWQFVNLKLLQNVSLLLALVTVPLVSPREQLFSVESLEAGVKGDCLLLFLLHVIDVAFIVLWFQETQLGLAFLFKNDSKHYVSFMFHGFINIG